MHELAAASARREAVFARAARARPTATLAASSLFVALASAAFAGEAGSAATSSLSGSPEELVRQGMQLLAGGDADGAIARFGKAQAERPNSPEIDLNLGLASFRKGEFDRAADYFAAAASKGGGRLEAVARYNLGNVRVRQGRFEEAAAAYRDALRASSDMDEARYNLELVEAHIEKMKKLEEQRKKAEEEFRRRLEELVKELSALVELQAQALVRVWRGAGQTEHPEPSEEDIRSLQELAAQKKPIPDELARKLARSLAKARAAQVQAEGTPGELAELERSASSRSHKAAETAAALAADLRRATGAAQGKSKPPQGETPPEHPLAGALERSGGAAEEAASALDKAAGELGSAGFAPAEPHAALGLWKLVQALGELASPEGQGARGALKELEAAIRRMADLRARQGALVRELWAQFPDSRGRLPSPEEQKAFWDSIRSGAHPSEEERAPLARLEIMAGAAKGQGRPAAELAEAERALAEESRRLAAELEAAAAKSPAQAAPAGELVSMLRGAAEAMDDAAARLSDSPTRPAEAEPRAVLAFIRLSRAPTQLDELLARLGGLLAEQTQRLLDTWKSEPASRGPTPSPEELSNAEKTAASGGELPSELEAKLGRLFASEIDRVSAGKAGGAVAAEEAAKLEGALAARTREAASDARRLAASGARPGEQNPAVALLEQAAGDLDAAASRMNDSVSALARSFAEAEPLQARAVAALMRALSRFASGASAEPGGESRAERPEEGPEEQKGSAEGEEKERAEEASPAGEPRTEERKKPGKTEPVSKEQAARLLDEASQEERDLRRDMRKLRGSRPVEVLRDW